MENGNVEFVQVVDSMDATVSNCLSNRFKGSNPNERDLTKYRKFFKVLDYILNSTLLVAFDGEPVCPATKKRCQMIIKSFTETLFLKALVSEERLI